MRVELHEAGRNSYLEARRVGWAERVALKGIKTHKNV
jgi:hypothetical protein